MKMASATTDTTPRHPPHTIDQLQAHAVAVLGAAGLSRGDAGVVAGSLVDAEARGIGSHGLTRLRIYASRLQAGLIDSAAEPTITTSGSIVRVNARNAAGQVGATAAMKAGMRTAGQHGVAMVGVRHSNHCGTLAYFTRTLAENGYAAIAMSTAPPTMTYFGGKSRAVGTNPISIAAPRGARRPIVVDLATSATARGKIILADQVGGSIPAGWAVDEEGRPTRDPQAALSGSMVPFGGPKGSGLAMMVDLICGALVGAAFGHEIGDMYDDWERTQRVSHLFIVMDPAAWAEVGDFAESVERFVESVSVLPPGAGHDRVLLPGELEDAAFDAARREGVIVPPAVLADLDGLAAELGVSSRLQLPTAPRENRKDEEC